MDFCQVLTPLSSHADLRRRSLDRNFRISYLKNANAEWSLWHSTLDGFESPTETGFCCQCTSNPRRRRRRTPNFHRSIGRRRHRRVCVYCTCTHGLNPRRWGTHKEWGVGLWLAVVVKVLLALRWSRIVSGDSVRLSQICLVSGAEIPAAQTQYRMRCTFLVADIEKL